MKDIQALKKYIFDGIQQAMSAKTVIEKHSEIKKLMDGIEGFTVPPTVRKSILRGMLEPTLLLKTNAEINDELKSLKAMIEFVTAPYGKYTPYKKGGKFHEGWGFSDMIKLLVKGTPIDRNLMFKELKTTFPDNQVEKEGDDTVAIYIPDQEVNNVKKMAKLFNMKVAYAEGGSIPNSKVRLVGIIENLNTSEKTFDIHIPSIKLGRATYKVNYSNATTIPPNLQSGVQYTNMSIEGKFIGNVLFANHILRGGSYAKGGLIAPNGESSNLTPEQYRLVRTPEFKSWFGDWENDPQNASKVVDENGEPLVVYHFSDSEFNIFELKGVSHGFFFTENKKDDEFSKISVLELLKEGEYPNWIKKLMEQGLSIEKIIEVVNESKYEKVKSFFLNIKKMYPFSWVGEVSNESWSTPYFENLYIDKARERDFNGIEFIREKDRKRIIVAFEPNQIKLADGTNTTFDSNNPDIRFEDGGRTDTRVAEIILSQIGGMGRVKMMTGAYNFVALKNGVSFRIKNRGANFVKITLNGSDLYDVEIGRFFNSKYKIVKTFDDVYFDQLYEVLYAGTGMYFKLFAKGGTVRDEEKDMINNQLKQIHHHEEELRHILQTTKDIEPWIIAKMERSTSNLSDVTHYLDGKDTKYRKGGIFDDSDGAKTYAEIIFQSQKMMVTVMFTWEANENKDLPKDLDGITLFIDAFQYENVKVLTFDSMEEVLEVVTPDIAKLIKKAETEAISYGYKPSAKKTKAEAQKSTPEFDRIEKMIRVMHGYAELTDTQKTFFDSFKEIVGLDAYDINKLNKFVKKYRDYLIKYDLYDGYLDYLSDNFPNSEYPLYKKGGRAKKSLTAKEVAMDEIRKTYIKINVPFHDQWLHPSNNWNKFALKNDTEFWLDSEEEMPYISNSTMGTYERGGKIKNGQSVDCYFTYNDTYGRYEPTPFGVGFDVEGQIISADDDWVKIELGEPIDSTETYSRRMVESYWL